MRAEHECDKFDTVNTALAGTATKTFSVPPCLTCRCFSAVDGTWLRSILWIGGRMIIEGRSGRGLAHGLYELCARSLNSLMMISTMFLLLTRALTSVGRIAEVLDEEPVIANPVESSRLRRQRTAVSSFRDVSFKYRADAAEDVLGAYRPSRIESGSTVGILGGTGSKSSLVQLIARLYDATEAAPCLWADTTCATTTSRPYVMPCGHCVAKECCSRAPCAGTLQWGNPQASDDELPRRLAARRAWTSSLDRIGRTRRVSGPGRCRRLGRTKSSVLCIARTLLKHPARAHF